MCRHDPACRPVFHSLTTNASSSLFIFAFFLHPYNTFTFLPLQSLVNKFSSAVNNQKPRIDQLDEDTDNLSDDINTLKEKVSSVPKK